MDNFPIRYGRLASISANRNDKLERNRPEQNMEVMLLPINGQQLITEFIKQLWDIV